MDGRKIPISLGLSLLISHLACPGVILSAVIPYTIEKPLSGIMARSRISLPGTSAMEPFAEQRIPPNDFIKVRDSLKEPIEVFILHGRPINMELGREQAYLGSWVSETFKIKEWLEKKMGKEVPLEEAIEWAKYKIKFFGRMLSIIEKLGNPMPYNQQSWTLGLYNLHFGHRLDILDNLDEKRTFEKYANKAWDYYYKEEDPKAVDQPFSVTNLLSDFQFQWSWPINYFVAANIGSEHKISQDVTYEGRPSIKVNNNQALSVGTGFGDWRFANELNLKILAQGKNETSVKLIIKNQKGQTAEFLINGLEANQWKEIKIPLWGPYKAEGMPDKTGSVTFPWRNPQFGNDQWTEWLKTPVLKKLKDQNVEYKSDNLTDWSNIQEVTFQFEDGTTLYVSGIYYPAESKIIGTFEEFKVLEIKQPVLIQAKDRRLLIVTKMETGKIVYIDPSYGPRPLEENLDKFRKEIWDGGQLIWLQN